MKITDYSYWIFQASVYNRNNYRSLLTKDVEIYPDITYITLTHFDKNILTSEWPDFLISKIDQKHFIKSGYHFYKRRTDIIITKEDI